MTYILVSFAKCSSQIFRSRSACFRLGKVYDVTAPFGAHFFVPRKKSKPVSLP